VTSRGVCSSRYYLTLGFIEAPSLAPLSPSPSRSPSASQPSTLYPPILLPPSPLPDSSPSSPPRASHPSPQHPFPVLPPPTPLFPLRPPFPLLPPMPLPLFVDCPEPSILWIPHCLCVVRISYIRKKKRSPLIGTSRGLYIILLIPLHLSTLPPSYLVLPLHISLHLTSPLPPPAPSPFPPACSSTSLPSGLRLCTSPLSLPLPSLPTSPPSVHPLIVNYALSTFLWICHC